MSGIRFTVEGRPHPWMRTAGRGHRYDPPENVAAKQVIGTIARIAMRGRKVLTERGVCVSFVFYLKRKGGQQPDLDNLIKTVKDALTGVVYRDDSLVTEYGDAAIINVKDETAQRTVVCVESTEWD